MRVAIVHDHLVHLAGGERVVLALTKAFPQAPVYTSMYEPSAEFPAFRDVEVRPSPLNRLAPLRRRHRWAMPLMAPAFAFMHIDADVLVCSSAGWAHGVRLNPPTRKIVYCHTPARWLYQADRYLGTSKLGWRLGLRMLTTPLRRWDRSAAASAHRYLSNSRAVADRVKDCYGLESEVLAPPIGIDPGAPQEPIEGIEPGYLLCVSRLLPYKNVDIVIDAIRSLQGPRLIIVGTGPDEKILRLKSNTFTKFVGNVSEGEMRWLYANCRAVVGASYEDFGLSIIEAAAFGKPAVALRWGGYLDSVLADETGVFFDVLSTDSLAQGIRRLLGATWDDAAIRASTIDRFGEDRFVARMQSVVQDEFENGARSGT